MPARASSESTRRIVKPTFSAFNFFFRSIRDGEEFMDGYMKRKEKAKNLAAIINRPAVVDESDGEERSYAEGGEDDSEFPIDREVAFVDYAAAGEPADWRAEG